DKNVISLGRYREKRNPEKASASTHPLGDLFPTRVGGPRSTLPGGSGHRGDQCGLPAAGPRLRGPRARLLPLPKPRLVRTPRTTRERCSRPVAGVSSCSGCCGLSPNSVSHKLTPKALRWEAKYRLLFAINGRFSRSVFPEVSVIES